MPIFHSTLDPSRALVKKREPVIFASERDYKRTLFIAVADCCLEADDEGRVGVQCSHEG